MTSWTPSGRSRRARALRAPAGGLLEVEGLEVKSVFNEWTPVEHYQESAGNGDWTFFGIGVGGAGDFNVHVDAVEQRPGDLSAVAVDLVRGAGDPRRRRLAPPTVL